MNNELTFWDYLLGETAKGQFAAALIFGLVGALISILFETTKRVPNSERTPFHFSWDFLWCDNVRRILRSVLLIIIAVRFCREMFGVDITMYFALGIGLGLDKVSELIKYKKRDKLIKQGADTTNP